MSLVIGVVSQKGGVGKSTLSRFLACEYAANEWEVKIADMDLSQGTCTNWNAKRLANDVNPSVSVEQFSSVKQALSKSSNFDLLIFDGEPHSTTKTLDIAKASDLIVIPTGISLDDLEPTIKLAHGLKKSGIPKNKIHIALLKVGDSKVEIQEAKEYINESGYFLLDGEIKQRTAIRRAMDEGKSAKETVYKSINNEVDQIINSIVKRVGELQE